MNEVLFCTHNPILIKSLYGILIDEGYHVEIVDHPAFAVQKILTGNYGVLIIDSKPFGLSIEDAIQIIKTISPDMTVIVVGYSGHDTDTFSIEVPIDLEEFKKAIHDIHRFSMLYKSLSREVL